jgi:hypothetical protein
MLKIVLNGTYLQLQLTDFQSQATQSGTEVNITIHTASALILDSPSSKLQTMSTSDTITANKLPLSRIWLIWTLNQVKK